MKNEIDIYIIMINAEKARELTRNSFLSDRDKKRASIMSQIRTAAGNCDKSVHVPEILCSEIYSELLALGYSMSIVQTGMNEMSTVISWS
jgi:hypothetical protein